MKPIRYAISLIRFYLKGEISADQHFVMIKTPHTLLRFIPLGTIKENVAINQISSTQSNLRINYARILFGIAFFVLAFAFVGDFGGMVDEGYGAIMVMPMYWLAIGVIICLSSLKFELWISTTSGRNLLISTHIFQKAKLQAAEDQINALINCRLDDTNVRQQADRIIEVIQDK